jgi:hypothetical protein
MNEYLVTLTLEERKHYDLEGNEFIYYYLIIDNIKKNLNKNQES